VVLRENPIKMIESHAKQETGQNITGGECFS
jgi:hypothetical protein